MKAPHVAALAVLLLAVARSAPAAPAAPAAARPAPHIAGGAAAVAGQFPWMASIRCSDCLRNSSSLKGIARGGLPRRASPDRAGRSGGHYCGGTLIAPGVVLTAAHCVTDARGRSLPLPSAVRLGCVLVSAPADGEAEDPGCEERAAAAAETHPSWTGRFERGSDVALLFLAAPSARPPLSALAATPPAPGAAATAVGWGRLTNGSWPRALQLAELAVSGAAEWGTANGGDDFTADARWVMTGPARRETCVGDSGGPLLDAAGALIGITSFGPVECGGDDGEPSWGAYTSVAEHLAWIRAVAAAGPGADVGGAAAAAAPPPPPRARPPPPPALPGGLGEPRLLKPASLPAAFPGALRPYMDEGAALLALCGVAPEEIFGQAAYRLSLKASRATAGACVAGGWQAGIAVVACPSRVLSAAACECASAPAEPAPAALAALGGCGAGSRFATFARASGRTYFAVAYRLDANGAAANYTLALLAAPKGAATRRRSPARRGKTADL
jgi:hypothetical protein